MTKTMTAKYLHEKLKRKWTASDFAKDLGISTDEFWDLLKKQFPGNSYKEFRISLRANEKHSKRTNTPDIFFQDSTVETPTPVTHEPSSDTYYTPESDIPESDSDQNASMPIQSETSEADITTPAAQPALPTLDELLTELENLCSAINDEELIHKDIVSARCKIRTDLQAHNQALIDLQKQVAQRKEDITQLLSQLASTETQMHESTVRNQALQVAKDAIESRIEKAKLVSIFIYNSGEIEVETQSTIQYPEWSDLLEAIIEEEELTSLTIKQAKALAKVIALVRLLITQGTPFEVSFEDQASENYFKKVIS